MTETQGPHSFGRVDDDGTVYVRTDDGERSVGQVPDATAEEALAFFVRRYESLEVEVGLLETRLKAGNVSPEETRKAVKQLRDSVSQANAVGDLSALLKRLDALSPVIDEKAEERRAQRAAQNQETLAAKEAMVSEAERISQGNDWRGGVNRFRQLLEQWKKLPRIDKKTDDELWHRFSSARTHYTKRRKHQFAEQAKKREGAKVIKERIIAEAEPLAESTDWGGTSAAFRDLMQQWKAAGPAPREVDEKLWQRFRGLQDQFFDARSKAQAEQDEEFRGNQQAKEALLDEAEKTVLPVTDVQTSKAAFRDFLEKFNEIGKVPRDAMRAIDGRVKALEKAVRQAEDDEWRRTDPEARKRASDTASKIQNQIDELTVKAEKAEARGDAKKAKQHRDAIATYQSWLVQAEKAVEDFSA
ncbi:DUF349 domain-containing protein [Propioniferax innocua]|uniref:Uncharacterized protein DUF349 n=1 Tax=Propioniferax innocua TaxID=1753 RepID=A0A542ZPX5_9ACTN|nr:DUF349 domain-containing protein [Propioniferax innocua]TQL62413.1 uncharacterized protein DUF349 [Propioniferax innocua]